MNDQYMLTSEFVALVLFLFSPPLFLALILETVFFVKKGVFARKHMGHAVMGYVFTVIGSLIVGAVIHELATQELASILRVRDIEFANMFFPVMPLAFISVALAASLVTWWIVNQEIKKA